MLKVNVCSFQIEGQIRIAGPGRPSRLVSTPLDIRWAARVAVDDAMQFVRMPGDLRNLVRHYARQDSYLWDTIDRGSAWTPWSHHIPSAQLRVQFFQAVLKVIDGKSCFNV